MRHISEVHMVSASKNDKTCYSTKLHQGYTGVGSAFTFSVSQFGELAIAGSSSVSGWAAVVTVFRVSY